MAVQSVNPSLYADPTSLDGLKREAATQSPEAIREAARQFESLFTSMMLKSMRSASGQDPLFGSDQEDMYQDMFDQQMAVQMSRGKGLGLADMLVRQLQGSATGVPAQAGAGAATGKSATAPAGELTGMTWAPQSQQDFVSALRPAATAAAGELGVDPDTIIAHAALETGWGRSIPAAADGRSSNNLFGIKAGGGWQGAAVKAATQEFSGGQMQRVDAGFRAYASPASALQDYVQLLKNNPRYAGALGTGTDAAAFARGLQRGGYATDPDYVAKLTAIAARLKSAAGMPLTTTNAV
ncbi:MAG TPA: flagellar assembly peptidoglycan hydrolase FlgJ [Steroidobacteraceae bacterium]|nr:flagellar assembly peptidoglycan hydrolase FlgJ [Steroidobacteraceae bacterium]